MVRIPVVVLVLISGVLAAPAREAKVGDGAVELTIPPGFCELDEKNSADARMLVALRNIRSGNQLLAVAADCAQLDDWRIGKRPLLDDFVQYQTPVSLLGKPLPGAPGELVKQVCALTRAEGEKWLSEVAPDIQSRIEATLNRVRINERRFVGVLAEDSTACYGALLQKLRTEIGTDKTQLGVYAITIVRGKVVYYYLFTPYLGAETVQTALAAQKVNTGAFIAANQN